MLMFSIPVAAASCREVLRSAESSANRIHTFNKTLHFVTSSLLQEIAVVEHARKASVPEHVESRLGLKIPVKACRATEKLALK